MPFLTDLAGVPDQNSLSQALDAAPDLVGQPSLAAAAAQSNDPSGTAQVLAHANAMIASQQAVHQHHSFFGSLLHDITTAPVIGTAFDWAGKGLHEVQQDYKFVHSIYVNHGIGAGLLATLGVGAGAFAGTFVGAPELGAAVAAGLEHHVLGQAGSPLHSDFQNSINPNYKVSPGRDFANALSQLPGLRTMANTDSGIGAVVSGIGDASFDFAADPLMIAGRLNQARKLGTLGQTETNTIVARSANRLKGVPGAGKLVGAFAPGEGGYYPLAKRLNDATGLFDRIAPGLKPANGADVLKAFDAYGGVRRAFGTIAGKSAAEIVTRFPGLGGDMSSQLADLPDAEAVRDHFAELWDNAEWHKRVLGGALPSQTLLRKGLQNTAEGLKNFQGDSVRRLPGSVPDEVRPLFNSLTADAKVVSGVRALPSRIIRTFSGYLPASVDPITGDLAGKIINASNPDSARDFYRVMRYSMGNKLALDRTNQLMAAIHSGDEALAKKVWGESMVQTLIAAGVPGGHDIIKPFVDMTRQLTGSSPDAVGEYGRGYVDGADVSHAPILRSGPNGEPIQASSPQALWSHQASLNFAVPDFNEVKRAAREANKFMNAVGATDDFFAKSFTQRYFKPMALINAGFGFRVAAAEAIPASLRYGAMNMLRASVAARSAKLNYRLDASADEAGHILAASAKLAGGVNNLLNNEETRNLAIDIVTQNGGHILKGVSSTGHNDAVLPSNLRDQIAATLQHVAQQRGVLSHVVGTGDFRIFDTNDPAFDTRWLLNLQKSAANLPQQTIVRDILSRVGSDGTLSDMDWRLVEQAERHRIENTITGNAPNIGYQEDIRRLTRYKNQDPADFAHARVDDIRNTFSGRDGVLHENLLQKVADGDKPVIDDLKDLQLTQKPEGVLGEDYTNHIGVGAFQRIVNTGFVKVIDPIINNISRQPMYFNAVRENMRPLMKLVNADQMDYEHALMIAQSRAIQDVIPQIHNPAIRSQFADIARNFAPFYFAQEQAMKRLIYATTLNPHVARGYQIIVNSLNNPGFIHQDSQGNRYVMIPGSGLFGQAVMHGLGALGGGVGMPVQTGLPMNFNGSLASLNTVLPHAGIPSASPLLAVPMNILAKLAPELDPTIKAALGDRSYGQNLTNEMIPNQFLRNIIRGYSGNEHDTQFANAYLTSLAAAAYHGHLPDASDPMKQQQFLDKVRNNARSAFYLKGILSLFSPLTPEPQLADMGKGKGAGTLTDEFYKILQNTKDYATALSQFTEKYGNRAELYSVAKSDNTIGANVPTSKEAVQFVEQNQGLLSKYRGVAAFLVPQSNAGDGDVQLLHSELLNLGIKRRDTPQQFMEKLYSQQGNTKFYDAFNAYKEQRDSLKYDPTGLATLKTQWANDQTALKIANPVWADHFYSQDRQVNAAVNYQELGKLFSDGQAPSGGQTDLVRGALETFERYRADLADSLTGRVGSHERTQIKDDYEAQLSAMRTETPALKAIIDSILMPLVQSNTQA